ncbi:MAG: phosphoribosylformylglycinamidine synthase subunit PurQ [Hyphomicrobiaceae bacterium]
MLTNARRPSVIVFPGSNCDRDLKVAFEAVLGQSVNMVWHGETELPASSLIALPGGFSYGDYLRCGAIASRSPIMRAVADAAARGMPVIGICNGFQVLCEAGLLPGVLMRNASLKFVCRDVVLRVENAATPFTAAYQQGQVIRVPIAHHDGNYIADDATIARLEDEGQVVVRYVDPDGAVTPAANPNGSRNNIAGICNAPGNVVGMMPHPERLFEPALGGIDGRGVFESVLRSVVLRH